MAKTKHHCVPQTYLKQWEDKKGFIWLYNTTDKTILHRNRKSIFNEKYLYSITLNEWNLLPPEEKKLFIEPLKPFKVFLNGKILTSQEIIENLSHWDEFEIKKQDNSFIKSRQKDDLLEKIRNTKHPFIEDAYSEQIESSWHEIVDFFENYRKMIIDNNITLPDANELKSIADKLVNFILSLYTRNPYNMSHSINRIKGKYSMKVDDPTIKTIFEIIQLNFLNGDRYLFDTDQFNIQFIFTTEDSYFITTDNPVFIRGIGMEDVNFKGILWCPITPNILVSLSKKTDNNYLCIHPHMVNKETIKKFNSIIYQNAEKYFVSSSEITDMQDMGFQLIYN